MAMSQNLPTVNSWTEFEDLEYICVGSAANSNYPENDPGMCIYFKDKLLQTYIGRPLGPRPKDRIHQAQLELQYLVDVLEGEQIKIGTVKEVHVDIQEELERKRSYCQSMPAGVEEDKRIGKKAIQVCRPAPFRFDHPIQTPWFKNNYQIGTICPRDTVITLGNTILETAGASRYRHFESNCYRNLIYHEWNFDKRIHWKTAPKPSCGDSIYNRERQLETISAEGIKTYARSGYKTVLNETEVAFDAADMIRIGKDVFYLKGASANNKGIDWLRREFRDLRFHMVHFPSYKREHLDINLIPLRAPSSGSEGILLCNQNYPPLRSEMKIFEENDWKVYWGPLAATISVSPVAICTSNLNMNLLSLSPNSVIIEECETPMYTFLEEMGFDVLTVPLRTLNEFGGGIHCVTWDIRRNDTCKDYFPNQDYKNELAIDLNQFYDDEELLNPFKAQE